MADFRRKKQFTTRVPRLKVEAGLPAGTYVFQLQVEDQSGNRSNLDRVKVRIVERQIPIRPIDEGDLRIDRVLRTGPFDRRP